MLLVDISFIVICFSITDNTDKNYSEKVWEHSNKHKLVNFKKIKGIIIRMDYIPNSEDPINFN